MIFFLFLRRDSLMFGGFLARRELYGGWGGKASKVVAVMRTQQLSALENGLSWRASFEKVIGGGTSGCAWVLANRGRRTVLANQRADGLHDVYKKRTGPWGPVLCVSVISNMS